MISRDDVIGYPDILLCDDCGAKVDGAVRHRCRPASPAPVFEYSVTDERDGVLRFVSRSLATSYAQGYGGTLRYCDQVLGSWPVPSRIRELHRKAHEDAQRIRDHREFYRELRRRAA